MLIKIICFNSFMTFFKRTWDEAREYCYQRRMHLVTVFSIDKQNCLFDALKGYN